MQLQTSERFRGIVSLQLLVPLLATAILLVAFWIRASGTGYSLPFVGTAIDEYLIADKAIAMLKTGDFDVRNNPGPMLGAYIQAAVGQGVLWYKTLTGESASANDILLTGDTSLWGGIAGVPEFYLWGRLVVAGMGSLTVLLVFLIGRAIYGSEAGLISSAFLALAPLHERESHWIQRDVPVTFFIVLTFYVMALGFRRRHQWLLVLGCAIGGLAVYAKSNGRIILLPVLLFLLFYLVREKKLRLTELGKVGIGLLLVVLLAVPFQIGGLEKLLDIPNYVLKPIWENSYVYGGSHPGMDSVSGWRPTLDMLTNDSWRYIAFLSLLGGIWLLFRFPVWTMMVASIPVANFVVFSFFTVRFDRWLIPMLPFMAILAGASIWDVTSSIGSRLHFSRYVKLSVCSVFMLLLLVGPLLQVRESHRAFVASDIRLAASRWIAANFEPGARVAVEIYSPAISARDFQVGGYTFLIDNDLDWYRRERFDYVVASSGAYGRFFAKPERYPDQLGRYEALFNGFPLVKEFSGAGPTVKILRVPDQAATAALAEGMRN